MTRCGKCGANMPNEARFCSKCGSEFPAIVPTNNVCKQCGRVLNAGDNFCLACGNTTIPGQPAAAQPIQQYQAPPQSVPPPMPQYQQMPPQPQIRSCIRCNAMLMPGQTVCPNCGTPAMGYARKDHAGHAGTLIILGALINMFIFGIAFLGSLMIDEGVGFTAALLVIFAANVFALYGGFQAMRRRRFFTCLASAFITIIGFVFFLGIIAIVLLAISREFFIEPNRKY